MEKDYNKDLSSFPNHYAGILSKSGLEKITGINQKQLWSYSSGRSKPNAKTTKKIQERIQHLSFPLVIISICARVLGYSGMIYSLLATLR
jgi:hypothetical protein